LEPDPPADPVTMDPEEAPAARAAGISPLPAPSEGDGGDVVSPGGPVPTTDEGDTGLPEKSIFREYVEALLIAVIFAVFARTYVVQAFKIPSGSMEKNLLIGDHILVNKFVYGPTAFEVERLLLPQRPIERGDVVVFKFPEDPTRDFIKRCVGLPGDQVEIADKQLVLNGKPVDDKSYTYHSDPMVLPRDPYRDSNRRDNLGPLQVAGGSYFCMGDNRDNSHDSRFWGEVPEGYVKGRAFLVYWSFDNRDGETVEWPGVASKLREVTQVARHFLPWTRWDRTFRIVR
jgi:signal peptidase I